MGAADAVPVVGVALVSCVAALAVGGCMLGAGLVQCEGMLVDLAAWRQFEDGASTCGVVEAGGGQI